MEKYFLLALFVLSICSPSRAWAWSEHHAITTAALKPMTMLAGVTVPYEDFSSLAHELGYADATDFNTQLQIAKSYRFEPKLGEEPGRPVAVLDILSKYSDEPDWGMDVQLFGEYPELWDPAYSMMGGREGLPSQAFRHMYWEGLDVFHMLKTFKLPVEKEFKAMGQAPERAVLFLQLAREARGKGAPYWAVRFTADALHYLQDCAQPYHTVQVPTKEFVFFPFFSKYGHGLSQYVAQMTNVISYYHYAFEDYVSELMVGAESGDGNVPGNQFIQDLSSRLNGPKRLSYADGDIAGLVRRMAELGVKESATAGRASIKFFPPLDEDFIEMDPRFNDHKRGVPFAADHLTGFEDATWWAQAKASGLQDSEGRDQYFKVVHRMFGSLGYAVRQVVSAELGWLGGAR